MSSARIAYEPRPDATPEREVATLADVYAFILMRAEERKRGGPETAPDDAKEIDDVCAEEEYTGKQPAAPG